MDPHCGLSLWGNEMPCPYWNLEPGNIWPIETCCTIVQKFFSRTGGGRGPTDPCFLPKKWPLMRCSSSTGTYCVEAK